jgi:hypothetical protein
MLDNSFITSCEEVPYQMFYAGRHCTYRSGKNVMRSCFAWTISGCMNCGPCRNLAQQMFRTVGEVLQHHPKEYQDCRYEMEDGRYTTILCTVVSCTAISSGPFGATLPLTFSVDPDEMIRLDNLEMGELSGTSYISHTAQHPLPSPLPPSTEELRQRRVGKVKPLSHRVVANC